MQWEIEFNSWSAFGFLVEIKKVFFNYLISIKMNEKCLFIERFELFCLSFAFQF